MTTLNARANQAYHAAVEESDDWPFDHQRDAYEEGWETGYKTRTEEIAAWLENLVDSVGDGSQRELFYDLAQEIRGKEVSS